MAEDVRSMLKEIRKRLEKNHELICETKIAKIDSSKQETMFLDFVNSVTKEFKKSSDEHKYVDTLIKDFQGMKMAEIRFAVERSYDRYDKVLNLMKKYEDNFDESELGKYTSKFVVLDKILKYMIENSVGEYEKSEE